MKRIKQSDDSKAFFEIFKFTKSSTRPHPKFTEYEIHFEGLEADYVNDLESTNENLFKHVQELRDRIFWLQEKEYRKTFQEIKASQESK